MENFLSYLTIGLANGFIYTLLAIGFVLIYKSSGIFNLALGELTIFGAYLFYAFVTQLKLPILAGLIGSIILMGLLGWTVHYGVFRPLVGQPILALLVLTLALGGLLRGLMMLFWGSDWLTSPTLISSTESIQLGVISVSHIHIAFVGISLLLVGLLALFFQRTKTGLAMMVVADDTVVARSLGIKINQILSICWCIAAIAAAMGGILLTNVIGVSYFYIELGFKSMAVALVGGLQSLWGLVIVGPLMGIIEYMAIGYINPLVGGDAEIVGPWIVLLLVLLVRPFGFFGWRKIERV